MAAGQIGSHPSPEMPQSIGPEEISLPEPSLQKRFPPLIQIRSKSYYKKNVKEPYILL
jgi:hypothetical protein